MVTMRDIGNEQMEKFIRITELTRRRYIKYITSYHGKEKSTNAGGKDAELRYVSRVCQ